VGWGLENGYGNRGFFASHFMMMSMNGVWVIHLSMDNAEAIEPTIANVARSVRGDAIKYSEWPPYRNCTTRMHGVPAQTGFPRTLTKTIYISAIFSTLNPILSIANLSRLECAETQFARKPRAYEYTRTSTKMQIFTYKGNNVKYI